MIGTNKKSKATYDFYHYANICNIRSHMNKI